MDWITKETKNLILEMSVGVICYNVVLGILAVLLRPHFSYDLVQVLLGFAAGAAADLVMLVHMGVMTERVLESQNENYANRTTLVHALIRKVVLIAAMLFLWRMFQINLVAMIIGALGLKAGAYLQPFVHKAFRCREEQDTDA